MFNRRDSDNPAPGSDRPVTSGSASSRKVNASFIGPSIQIEGNIVGSEDLLVEGEVRGKVELKSNKLTIGPEGRIFADVHAKQVCVEGQMDGHLVVQEQLEIRSSARIKGNITAPRISLMDGARFNGTIDMDPQAQALKEVFSTPGAKVTTMPSKAEGSDGSSGKSD
jgi:cytoskeletal protein CcmA (bactofilin family)